MNFDRIRHQHLQKPSELESGRSKYPERELVVPICTAIMVARDLRHLAVGKKEMVRAAPSAHQPARTAAPARGWDISARRPRRRGPVAAAAPSFIPRHAGNRGKLRDSEA